MIKPVTSTRSRKYGLLTIYAMFLLFGKNTDFIYHRNSQNNTVSDSTHTDFYFEYLQNS